MAYHLLFRECSPTLKILRVLSYLISQDPSRQAAPTRNTGIKFMPAQELKPWAQRTTEKAEENNKRYTDMPEKEQEREREREKERGRARKGMTMT